MKAAIASWQFWAILSAGFAALTAIFGKIGVENINSNFATLIRTAVIFPLIALIVGATGSFQHLSTVTLRTWTFLGLSGAATGLSWLCYYRALQLGPASRVAPIGKVSVVIVAVVRVALLGERLSSWNWIGIS